MVAEFIVSVFNGTYQISFYLVQIIVILSMT